MYSAMFIANQIGRCLMRGLSEIPRQVRISNHGQPASVNSVISRGFSSASVSPPGFAAVQFGRACHQRVNTAAPCSLSSVQQLSVRCVSAVFSCRVTGDVIRAERLLTPPSMSHTATAVRSKHMIIIRREKMKKHKRRKLLRKMSYIWTKLKMRRTAVKEKAFQKEQLLLIAEANKFDARQYVDGILQKASTAPLSTVFNGTRQPYFIRLKNSPVFKKLD